ncbi:MAG: T9SS type A sorting domain-containing protein [Taibaiella sp.]|nr:T9SS type A sorting domain-containing protein [Taibaiella sp.]
MKKSIPVFLFLFVITLSAFGNSYYLFQRTTGTYAELNGDTAVNPITTSPGTSYQYSVLNGDIFTLFNISYPLDGVHNSLIFSTDGSIGLETDTSFIIFDGMFTYLDSIDNTSKVSYKVEGSGNNKILKVQWKNLGLRGGPTGNYVNVQMWLYKATGVLEVHYGPSSANNATGYDDATGPNVGVFHSNEDFSVMYEKIWLNGTPSAITIDSMHNTSFAALHGVPANGEVYVFSPRNLAVEQTSIAHTFSIYPNPASNELTLKKINSYTGPINLTLSDITGRVLSTTVLSAADNSVSINTTAITSGLYILTATTLGSSESQAIIVGH